MGFGILFIGYFLVLNFAYAQFTDAIAATVMLYALYKLSYLNREFKIASYFTMLFSILGLFELAVGGLEIFSVITPNAALNSSVSIVRSFTVGMMTVFMLRGMGSVAKEVGISSLSEKCGRLLTFSAILYPLLILLECGGLGSFIDPYILAYASVILIFAELVLISLNLTAIYTCYMRICMPDEEAEESEKKSRFGFVNAMREHQEMRNREYAEYRLEKLRKRAEKIKEKQNVKKKK